MTVTATVNMAVALTIEPFGWTFRSAAGTLRAGANLKVPQTPMPEDAHDTDAALLARFAQGDQSAARLLAARHAPRALSVATRMLGDAVEAQDITQEAMIRMFRIAPEWQADRAKLSTWLYRVVSNLCIDRLRARRGGTDPLDEVNEPADTALTAPQQMEADDRVRLLHDAIGQLPERQRLAITLRHIEELSNPDIATILETSVDAVESLLSRGRRTLTTLLARHREDLEPVT